MDRFSIKDITKNMFIKMTSQTGQTFSLVNREDRTVFHNEGDVLNMYDFVMAPGSDEYIIIDETMEAV